MPAPNNATPADDTVCPGCHGGDFPDFDHWVQARGIQPEDFGAAFAAWLHLTSSQAWNGGMQRAPRET